MRNIITIILFTLSLNLLGQDYCIPSFGGDDNHIENMAFHTLVNTYSGSAGYTLYAESEFTTTVSLGGSYALTVSKDSDAGTTSDFAAWIDFNNDEVFSDDEQILFDEESNYSSFSQILIPDNEEFLGQRRLRVISTWNGSPTDACGDYNAGEAEDYVITIISGPDAPSYCTPFLDEGFSSFMIDDFELGTLTNNDSDFDESGYTLYSPEEFTTELIVGEEYPVFISKGISAGLSGGYAVWIDLNADGVFSEEERLYASEDGVTSTTGVIMIPDDASIINGERRVRVRSEWSEIPTIPCGLHGGGETEDYTVTITGGMIDNVGENEADLNLVVYPNPASEEIRFTSDLSIQNIELFSILGQAVTVKEITSTSIDVSHLERGLYAVKVTLTNGSVVSRQVEIN